MAEPARGRRGFPTVVCLTRGGVWAMRVPPVPGMLGEDRLCSPRPGGHLLGAGQMTPRHPGQGCSHMGPWHCWPWGQEELSRPKGHSPTRLSHKRGDLRLSRPRVRLTPVPEGAALLRVRLPRGGQGLTSGLKQQPLTWPARAVRSWRRTWLPEAQVRLQACGVRRAGPWDPPQALPPLRRRETPNPSAGSRALGGPAALGLSLQGARGCGLMGRPGGPTGGRGTEANR